jgi:hypothetical protein
MIEILSDAEIEELTHYKRPAEQLRELAALGVPARRLRDNTVRVLRMHLAHPSQIIANTPPQRKSAKK